MPNVEKHPCFEKQPTGRYARIHLPVALDCNIKCRYCDRKFDCANESRPGVTSKVLTPQEALKRIEWEKEKCPSLTVAGIAGPGEPLYNQETFETFLRIREKFPEMILCVSTNGLLLEEKLEELLVCGVRTLTVTMNTVTKEILPLIYANMGGVCPEEFLKRQKNGIQKAVEAGLAVKINMVLIPDINECEVEKVAVFAKEAGAVRMNLMPLIPQAELRMKPRIDQNILNSYREKASAYLPQMYHCCQCRADACGFLKR